jgi:anti-anti-sigma regulatory factor
VQERRNVSVRREHGSITLVREDGGGPVLVLTGEIDTAVLADFARTAGTEATPVAAIDAGAVTLLSATAVDLLLRHLQAAGAVGLRPVLRRSNPHVDRVLVLLDVADAFPRPGPGA